jgi:hypothetical protein
MKRYASVWTLAVAMAVLALAPGRAVAQQASPADIKAAEAMATPKLPNGKPDLTGFYLTDSAMGANKIKPPYKSDAMAKVSAANKDKAKLDPVVNCLPAGLPRIGPPHQIVENNILTVITYGGKSGHYSRLIPTDGRPHRDDLDPSNYGDSIGMWDGDTLVVDTNGLDESTWLGPDGWLHSDALHVTERLHRVGNVLHYQVTVEDPKMFTKPWVWAPMTILVNPHPENFTYKDPVCNGKDFD